MFKNKDQLANYLISGHVHLSKKDYGFFNNMKILTTDKKPITSNQDKLFNKLLIKYQRQLNKLGHEVQKLTKLSWKHDILESKQEYLDAYISIHDTTISIRAPFNNKFIQAFRKIPLNKFVWNKNKKIYEASFSTYQLKIAIDNVNNCYESVKYCAKVNQLLVGVSEYVDVKYWKPTLVKIHDQYYILASNSYLDESTKHIELNDDLKTFYILSQYGVTVHEDLIIDKKSKFASEYITSVDTIDLIEMCDWLNTLNVKYVFTSRDIVYNKELSNDLKLALLEKGIACRPVNLNMHKNSVLLKTHANYTLFSHMNYDKIIHLTNSRPVKIR